MLYGWITEAREMVGIADNIVNLFENGKETWMTELTVCNKRLGEAAIRRGIFQGILFQNQKLNHLLFTDDLKVYAKSETELDSLIQTVMISSDDFGMVFVLERCVVIVLKRGKVVRTEGIELPKG